MSDPRPVPAAAPPASPAPPPASPAIGTVLLGLALLALSLSVLVQQLRPQPVDWARIGPYAVIGSGLLLAALGALGLRARRRG